MKLILKTIALIVLISIKIVQAQAPEWEVAIKGKYDWMTVHQTGILLVKTSESLLGIDPETKQVQWQLPDMPIDDADDLQNIENTPFARVEKSSPIPGKDRTIILDVYRGLILFDSKTSDIKRIDIVEVLPSINRLYVKGRIDKKPTARLIDLEDGKSVWETDLSGKTGFMVGMGVDIDEEAYIPFTDKEGNVLIPIPLQKKLRKVDGKTGQTIWEKETGIIKRIFVNPKADKVYTYVREGKGLKAVSTLMALDIQTGEPIWKNQDVRYNFHLVYETGFILGMNGHLQLVDYDTGKPIQEFKVDNGEDIKFFRYTDNGILIATYGSYSPVNNNKPKGLTKLLLNRVATSGSPTSGGLASFVYLLDKQGNRIWKSEGLRGNFYNFDFVGQNALYLMTEQQFNLIDLSSGNFIQTEEFNFTSETQKDEVIYAERIVFANKQNDYVILYTDSKVYKIGFSAIREYTPIISKVNFRGGKEEKPNSLEQLDNGNYLLSSNQNLLCFNQTGSVLYSEYYPKPGRFGRFMGRLALSLGKTLLRTAVYYFLMYDALTNGLISQAVAGINQVRQKIARVGISTQIDLDTWSVNMNIAMSNRYMIAFASIPLNGKISKSYEQIQQREQNLLTKNQHKYIFSKSDEKVEGLLKINTEDNKTLSFIKFDDKSPAYEIDNFNGNLYFVNEQGSISVFSLNKN
jgi:outer membrane protein assembly factor BamB